MKQIKPNYEYNFISIPIGIDDYIETMVESKVGYSSFEYALESNGIQIDAYKIVPVNNHFEVRGLLGDDWIKLKATKTYAGATKYIMNGK